MKGPSSLVPLASKAQWLSHKMA